LHLNLCSRFLPLWVTSPPLASSPVLQGKSGNGDGKDAAVGKFLLFTSMGGSCCLELLLVNTTAAGCSFFMGLLLLQAVGRKPSMMRLWKACGCMAESGSISLRWCACAVSLLRLHPCHVPHFRFATRLFFGVADPHAHSCSNPHACPKVFSKTSKGFRLRWTWQRVPHVTNGYWSVAGRSFVASASLLASQPCAATAAIAQCIKWKHGPG
jgi:hypothetical protein